MIKDLKDLETLLKLCRKKGVSEIKLGGVFILFDEASKKTQAAVVDDDPETDELTPEQLMFFSAGGTPP